MFTQVETSFHVRSSHNRHFFPLLELPRPRAPLFDRGFVPRSAGDAEGDAFFRAYDWIPFGKTI